jgi:hypothetical protein
VIQLLNFFYIAAKWLSCSYSSAKAVVSFFGDPHLRGLARYLKHWFLGIDAHWNLFQYFFRFTCLRDGARAATIGCANLRTKQGRDDNYIPVMLTSSNSGWHKGWFYLRNDPEHALPAYTGCSIAKSQRKWADGPAKKEQEKMLKSHWDVLGRLRKVGITLAEVAGQYHARGVASLRRRPLRLCDMTADRAPWVGTVTALELPSPLEVQHRVAQAIGRSTYSWPPSRMLPMLPNAGTEKIVSCSSSWPVTFAFCHRMIFSRLIFGCSCRCS